MTFDISQHLDGAAAAVHTSIHGGGYDDLHASVKCKYRDIVTNTLSGVLLGRADYEGVEAIAADVIRGWGRGNAPVRADKVLEQPKAVSGDAVKSGLVESVKKLAGRGKRTTDK